MAFYEMLPGAGMPSGLQAGMDSVLNKKFGTSTTYPAEGWPDTVNLMGPLPEKTVSSSPIVTFSDGADTVPLKKCEITLPASLDGYSSVDVVHCGKNILNGEDAVKTANNIRFYYTNGKYYHAGTYTLSISETVQGIYVRNVSTSANISVKYNTNFITFTLTEQTLIGFDFYKVGINQDDNVMLEVGSTASTFEHYSSAVYTASLGRTIYGGSGDVVNGQGTDGYIKYVIDGVNVYGYLTGSNNMNIMPYGLNIDGTISKWLCDTLTANSTNFGYNSNQGFIFIRQAGWSSIPNVTDETTFNAYCQENPITLILPLATQETFTFDPVPIDSKLGNNTIWSDSGDTEVTYRADINLALGGN